MGAVQGKDQKELTYIEIKEIIQENLAMIRRSFISVGYYLKYVRDHKLYLEDGYQSIWEFAEDNYGLRKSTASRWMTINDRFSENGNSPLLADRYKDFGKSQLQEMLYLTDEQMEQVEPEMTAKEIRAIRKPEEPQQENEIIPEVELRKPNEYERTYFNKLAEHLINSYYDWFLKDYENRVMQVGESPKELKRKLGCNNYTRFFSVEGGVAHANLFDDYVQLWDEKNCCIGNFDWFYLASAIQSQWNVVALKEVEEKQKDKKPLNLPEEPVAPAQQANKTDKEPVAPAQQADKTDKEIVVLAQQEPEHKSEEIYEELSDRSDLELLQEEIQIESQTLEALKGAGFGENDIRVRKKKLLIAALAGFECDLDAALNPPEEPEQPELPKLKNNDQRKEFLSKYKAWPVWFEVPEAAEVYHRFDLEDGSSIVICEYHTWVSWKEKYIDENPDSIGTRKYLLKPGYKYLFDCASSESLLVEHLKNVQKGGANKQKKCPAKKSK